MQVARSASSSTMDVAARRPRPLTGSLSRALADSDTTRDRPETPESAGAVAAIQGERPTFSIKLSRPSLVYFDNDLIEGNLVIDCASEVVIPKLTVALVCRLVVRDVLAPDLKTAHTLYKTSKVRLRLLPHVVRFRTCMALILRSCVRFASIYAFEPFGAGSLPIFCESLH